MRTYKLNDKESKTLLNMADDCIDRGMIEKDYEIDKINNILNYGYELYGEFRKDLEIEIEIRIKNKIE